MGPIRGQTRPLPVAAGIVPEAQHIDAELNARIHNRFDIEVIDSTTGEVRQRAQAENVVCAGLFHCIMSADSTYLAYGIAYGGGSGTPSASDTKLFSKIGYKRMGAYTTTKISDTVWSTQGNITILENENVGVTLSELGLATYDAALLCTHAMLKDQNGNQISIIKTATDVINIYATTYIHFGSMNGFYVYGGTDDYLKAMMQSLCGMGSWSQSYCEVNYQSISGVSATAVGFSVAKSSDYKVVTLTAERIAAAKGNYSGGLAGIQIYLFTPGYPHGAGFATALPASWYPGSDIVGEAIGTGDGTTTAFATDFVHATNATVYVNGVATPAVTVTDAATVTNNIVFTTAPASGAVITADYHTSVIAKDANHVFDFSLTIQLGEHTA